jgi:hypothetical protein
VTNVSWPKNATSCENQHTAPAVTRRKKLLLVRLFEQLLERSVRSMTFSNGIRAGMSIAIGYFPIALTFGLLAKTTGLSMWEATAMSIFVFAGASQYISLTLISTGVDPILIVLNTFVVNIRHFNDCFFK